MKLTKKTTGLLLLLIASFCSIFLYEKLKEKVFPIADPAFDLSHRLTMAEIQELVRPLYNLPVDAEYKIETFVERNSLKFLQQTLTPDQFNNILRKENLQLWGWTVHFKKPLQATIQISQQKKLIGFHFTIQPQPFNPIADIKLILKTLEEKTGKDFSSYEREDRAHINNGILVKLKKNIPDTKLVETITIFINHGKLERLENQILLPNTYAFNVNQQIEKQKTIHHFFNVFHYLLIAIIFIFLFKFYENHSLRWKSSLYIFLVLFLTQFISNLFGTRFHDAYMISILQSLIRTVGYASWTFLLVVAADIIARQTPSSTYGLSDVGTKKFFLSEKFRESVLAGWFLFVIQIVLVGLFYKVFQNYASYVPLKIPGEHSLNCTLEFLKYFSESLSTSIYEESLYRLFLISFFILIFKKNWIAIVLSSVLWGFLHFSYQFEPYYIRGLELSLVGIVYGFAMIRYGVLSVILAHFLYNNFVMSEYEFQFMEYNIGVIVCVSALYSMSYIFRKNDFIFHRPEKLQESQSTMTTDRRNILRRIVPMNWKYGLVGLALLLFVLSQVQIYPKDANPLANQHQLQSISSKLINTYARSEVWNVTYHRNSDEIEKINKIISTYPNRKELEALIKPYEHTWSIRYFSKDHSMVVCDFDYSHSYELIGLDCDPNEAHPKSFDEWVRLIKDPQETWTVFDIAPMKNGVLRYEYNIAHDSSGLTKKALITFKNNQLIHFKKLISINYLDSIQAENNRKNFDVLSIGLSIILIVFVFLFVKFLITVLKDVRIYDRKSMIGAYISGFVYVLWKLNAYKEIIVDWNGQNTLQHFFFNELLTSTLKLIALGFFTYFLFFAFFYFPSRVFKMMPTSKEWSGILSRPVWKWRNTRVSLVYAALLLCIQTLLRMLIQLNGHGDGMDLFHFNVSFLNHEYLFITFMGLLWKSLLFWISLMVVITIMEKFMKRWMYLTILAAIALANILTSEGNLDTKLIEICAFYIVFYFVYNVARFDFSFYFWFILLNTLMTFVPVLVYKQYASYLYQVIFIFIFVIAAIFYTVIRGKMFNKFGDVT